jgi:predicted phage-related endonuclease
MTIEHHVIPDGHRLHPDRQNYLGASEVAAAAGLDPYRSALSLFIDKSGQAPMPVTENAAMRRGIHAEKMALGYLGDMRPQWTIEQPGVWITDDECRLACTPDAFATEVDGRLINVQIKTVARPVFDKWNGAPPLHYQLQVTAENYLTGADHGILAALVLSAWDADLQLFYVPRHPAAEAKIRDLAKKFWADVDSGNRPLPDFTRDAELIKSMFPSSTGEVLDLGDDNRLAEILPRREELKDYIDGYRKELEGLDAEVRYKLGNAEVAELPGWRITLKEETRKAYQVAESVRRVLRVKQLEDRT